MSNQVKSDKLVLEQSTNTHQLEGEITYSKDFGNGDFVFEGDSVLTHGEHKTLSLKGCWLKTNQMEENPVTKQLQKAFD